MAHIIIVDESALKECVESNIYQSRHFDSGNSLVKAISGDGSVGFISSRLIPVWKKGNLYLLQSRVETGYLLISSDIFNDIPNGDREDDKLLFFQRVCRFALKEWKGLSFSLSEMWSQKTKCGVVFPYPKSKNMGFRITLAEGSDHRRIAKRHGTKHLFAFAAGFEEESKPSDEQDRLYKRAFEELGSVRTGLDVQIKKIEETPADLGFHPLVLTDANQTNIRFQSYDEWLNRLTVAQKAFVASPTEKPQRVEGPAGTGKTLSLMLRAFYLCREAEKEGKEFKILFVSHGEATKNATVLAFDSLGEPFYHRKNDTDRQKIEMCTLQEWCGRVLGEKEVGNAQYLDQDALQAKEMRKLILKDIIEHSLVEDVKALEYLSPECKTFFQTENTEYIAELLQHEIGVMIKGRAAESLESYLKLPLLAYCLPTKTENDKRFTFSLYTEYQDQLSQSGYYDTDDIVLSTLGRLNTPIWRRRRVSEGFDAVIIDETHLFNFNELSVFHYFTRDAKKPRIVFSIDRSQAPGERGITTKLVREVLTSSVDSEEAETRTQIVFRCSPAIVRLAEAITMTGAMLFVTFENPLVDASSIISATDEQEAHEPVYWNCKTEADMCRFVIQRAKELCNQLKCRPSDVLMVATTESLITSVSDLLKIENKGFVQIVNRGDLETVQRAAREGAYVISHPDYVGGLEFKAVLIAGVDEGRLPPLEGIVKDESRHFVEFKACNRLYVAVSRARLAVELFYSAERGPSSLLEHARSVEAVVEKNAY